MRSWSRFMPGMRTVIFLGPLKPRTFVSCSTPTMTIYGFISLHLITNNLQLILLICVCLTGVFVVYTNLLLIPKDYTTLLADEQNLEQFTWLSKRLTALHSHSHCSPRYIKMYFFTTYGPRAAACGPRKPCLWPARLAIVLLKNCPVWCFRRTFKKT